jgi:mono/diheme cytochrome c family protein
MSGEALFDEFCADCHGSSGGGSFLQGVPANRNTELNYWEVKIKIKHGSGEDSDMPVFKELTDSEVSKIASYLKSLK